MPAPTDYAAIGKAILDQLGAQAGLATTLATAISGGLVALVIQIALHNRSGGTAQPLTLTAQWLVPLALLMEVASLLSGYAARGAITNAAPVLMQLPSEAWQAVAPDRGVLRFSAVHFDGSGQLAFLIATQFITMMAGLILVCFFAVWNLKTLLGR